MNASSNRDLETRIRKVEEQHQERAKEIAILEERMNTKSAENESALDRLRADMANWKIDMANWKTDMANWKTDMAKRENRLLLAMLGGIAAATAILGVLIAGIPTA